MMDISNYDFRREILKRIQEHQIAVCIVGMGYVGVPLAEAFIDAGFRVIGYDIDSSKIEMLQSGRSGMAHLDDLRIVKMNASTNFFPTSVPEDIEVADAILICVPTPLDEHGVPSLSAVEGACLEIAKHTKDGAIIVLESTTWPGTTSEVIRPIFEKAGHHCGKSIALAYSPEREDPGNKNYSTKQIPKVVGADSEHELEIATALYDQVVEAIPVDGSNTAEATKILENTYRLINISLANELHRCYRKLNIDIHEVIELCTGEIEFDPFRPGPGIGGHCIPIDPFYLTWRARKFGLNTRLINTAGEIESRSADDVVNMIKDKLNESVKIPLRHSKILIIGVAYKKNISDSRESPAQRIIVKLIQSGANVEYHDPYIEKYMIKIDNSRKILLHSKSLSERDLKKFDVAVVLTDHDCVNLLDIKTHVTAFINTRE